MIISEQAPTNFTFCGSKLPKSSLRYGVDVKRFTGARHIPVVYKVDFGTADGFFLANKFKLRDQDMIFVGEALTTDLNKVFGDRRCSNWRGVRCKPCFGSCKIARSDCSPSDKS